MKKFHFYNVSCPRRRVDSQKIYNYLLLNRYTHTDNHRQADIIVISTCAVTKIKEDISVKAIESYLDSKTDTQLIIVGCLPGINPSRLRNMKNLITVTPDRLEELDNIIGAKIEYKNVQDPNILDNFVDYKIQPRIEPKKYARPPLVLDRNNKKIYNLRISSGCNGSCSYCAIKYAIGRTRSKPIRKVSEEMKRGLESGYETFMLIADETGSYGMDIGTDIAKLLSELFSIEGRYSLILLEFSPRWLIKYYPRLKPLFTENAHKLEYLVIPAQSGSDKILKKMNRGYTVEQLKLCLADIYKNIPEIRVMTHLIVGFPGETEADFNRSVELICDYPFIFTDIYRYDDRPGTAASILPDKIPSDIVDDRIRHISGILRKKYNL